MSTKKGFDAASSISSLQLQSVTSFQGFKLRFRCRKQHQFVATKNTATPPPYLNYVSMPQAASVRCNNAQPFPDIYGDRSFDAASSISSLQHCSEFGDQCQKSLAKFRCRKQHQFVATCFMGYDKYGLSSFDAASSISSLQPSLGD